MASLMLAACGSQRSSSSAVPDITTSSSAQQALADGFRPLSLHSGPHGTNRKRHHKKFAGLVPGTMPDRIDPNHIPANLPRHISEVSVPPNAGEKMFAAMRSTRGAPGSRSAQNVVYDPDRGGQFGIYSDQGAFFYSGTFGAMTGYETVETAFAIPLNDWLYAPTSRGPGGACLEIGTSYTTAAAQVYAFDFCDSSFGGTPGVGKFHYLFTIDGSFRSSYERDYGDGLPSYLYETYFNYGSDRWDVLIYNASANNNQGQWELRYESQSKMLNSTKGAASGWNMFETHYMSTQSNPSPSSACPLTLEAHSANSQWINPNSGGWEYLDTIPLVEYRYRVYDVNNQCLDDDDGSGRGYYYLMDGISLHEWYVDAYPSQADQCYGHCGGYPYYPPIYYYVYNGPCYGGQHFTGGGGGPCPFSKNRSPRSASRRTTTGVTFPRSRTVPNSNGRT